MSTRALSLNARPRHGQSSDQHTAWIIVVVALVSLIVGILAAVWFVSVQDAEQLPGYVEFRALDAQSAEGMVVVWLNLEVADARRELVDEHKPVLEARFKAAIAAMPLQKLYSREGKERLARGLQRIADQEVGKGVVEGVYFGDFKIYAR